MRRKLRITGIVCCSLLLVMAVVALVLYRCSQREPDAYRDAIEIKPAVLEEASDQMLQKTTALVSDVEREGDWEALFTAEQINGFLAVDLARNHPAALPKWLSDPRVAIKPDRVMLFGRIRRGKFDSVVTLAVEPYVPNPNVLALRIRGVRAGIVPMPLGNVLEAVSQTAQRSDIRLHWKQTDGDPVAMITLPATLDDDDKLIQIETLRLAEGEIYVSGTTAMPDTMLPDEENENTQR